MPDQHTLARQLALSIIGGTWDKPAIQARIVEALEDTLENPQQLAARLIFQFDNGRTPQLSRLTDFLQCDDGFYKWCEKAKSAPLMVHISLKPSQMEPPPAALFTLPLPQLATLKALSQWLNETSGQIAWLADCFGRQQAVSKTKLHHYHYAWCTRKSGQPRLIEIPKAQIKTIQHQILKEILDCIPKHPAAHGFQRKRSRLTHAQNHLGKAVVIRMDLKNFFHSINASRIVALFHTLGYPWEVARYLAGFCTHSTSPKLVGDPFLSLPWHDRKRLMAPHLPQGAPTSPALANLCTWRMDLRLQALVEEMGLSYTRYADDLAFSGERSLIHRFSYLQGIVGAIVAEEGFRLNHRKTHLMTAAQRQSLAGVVVNVRPNIPRKSYDRIKATLYNCINTGPSLQNRQGHKDFRAHLQGKISDVHSLNPSRGQKLTALFQQIDWGQ